MKEIEAHPHRAELITIMAAQVQDDTHIVHTVKL